MIDIANEQGKFDGDIVLIKPIEFGNLDMFHKQDCQYTVSLRGNVNGEAKIINRIVTSVADAVDTYNEYDKYMGLAEIDTLRFVVSNTTEAGIVYDDTDKFELEPPKTVPGKLTKFLYHRFETFKGDMSKGLVMLPVELIDDNGIMLKKCVMQLIELWGLGDEFKKWVDEACVFTSTLVDRIITGYPRATEKEEWEKLEPECRWTKVEAEAHLIAGRIRKLMEAGQVTEDGKLRPVRYGDIVILLRTMSGWSETFVRVLQEEGIPACAQSREGYFQTVEVETLLA